MSTMKCRRGTNGCLKNMVLTAFMVAVVVVQLQHVSCNGVGVGGNGFVQRSGTNFVVNGKRFYFNGFNAYWLMYMGTDPSTRSKVTTTLQQASIHGLRVARTWAFNDGPNYRALQISPGTYDENVFRGLDFVVSEARKYGVRLILSFVNNWKDFGGKNQYVQWAREHGGQNVNNEDDFFSNPVAKQYYKNHIKAVVGRRNTITGVAYKDDPTIFAWELMNEPRSQSDYSGKVIKEWVIEMAAFVKSIDTNHLLEVGLEGFYDETRKQFNPGFQLVGTDFISSNQVPQVDFATIHLYPDEWMAGANEVAKGEFVDKWIKAHIEDTQKILGKPIVVGEFGKSSKTPGYSVAERDSYMRKIYDAIFTSASSGGPCAGGLFWQLMAQQMDGFRDGNEIIFQESPSTTKIIDQQSYRMSSIS
ncbi:mannan endo-1,4-beta-mannosidase 4 [Arachis duranensis]|uniref:mannan endo-1,4-beta-mannosidase n=1 Tax=Arachis duranensis TaxID=130453 RepID=A0A6P5M9M0_ARADU|nr:mannan endo-1,4-beta-mannosidase 4 [Arachis duranensis]XP_052118504.1 mannan endo-1,4-beta-mannosidase 4 [Arachis duranensis]